MDFYDDPKQVKAYLDMASDYDNQVFLDLIKQEVRPGSSLLELGMGPGKDLLALSRDYKVTGSDRSQVFVDLFMKQHKDMKVLCLDAVTIDIMETYDCIYSNKVLMHVNRDQLVESLKRQKTLLKPSGQVIHSLWKGEGEETFNGLYFACYSKEDLENIFRAIFDEVKIIAYKEEEDGDSLLVVAR